MDIIAILYREIPLAQTPITQETNDIPKKLEMSIPPGYTNPKKEPIFIVTTTRSG